MSDPLLERELIEEEEKEEETFLLLFCTVKSGYLPTMQLESVVTVPVDTKDLQPYPQERLFLIGQYLYLRTYITNTASEVGCAFSELNQIETEGRIEYLDDCNIYTISVYYVSFKLDIVHQLAHFSCG